MLSNQSQTNIKGALLEAYVAGHHKDQLSEEKGFRVADVIEHMPAYGLKWTREKPTDTLKQIAKNVKMRKCFIRFSSLHQDRINEVVQRNSQLLEVTLLRRSKNYILSNCLCRKGSTYRRSHIDSIDDIGGES